MPEKHNHMLPGYDSIASSLYKGYRWEFGSLNPDLLNSGMITKVNTSLTTVDNVSHFIHGKETDNTYVTKFASSFDSILSPYTTYFAETGTPHFEAPTKLNVPNSLTLNPFNPNNSLSLY